MDEMKPAYSDQSPEIHTWVGTQTRWVATLVLIPSVPLFVLSVGALALFYIAPTWFGNIIARLPGETFIRSALFFAPVTLFAVIVLAFLYALERPVTQGVLQPTLDVESRTPSGPGLLIYAQTVARVSLAPAVLGLLITTSVWALSFVSPGRYDRLMGPLPGDRFLRPLVPWAPLVMFLIVLGAMYFSLGGGPGVRSAIRMVQSVNLAVLITLVSAIPLLILSIGALGLSYLSPDRFERILTKLPYESFVRLAISFAPVVLFAIVALAILYVQGKTPLQTELGVTRTLPQPSIDVQQLRSRIAIWVLAGGLIFSAAVGLGLLSVVIYLVVR
jgi:hypothetical protein